MTTLISGEQTIEMFGGKNGPLIISDDIVEAFVNSVMN